MAELKPESKKLIQILETPPNSMTPDRITEKILNTPILATKHVGENNEYYKFEFSDIIKVLREKKDLETVEYFENDPERPIGEILKIPIYCCREHNPS